MLDLNESIIEALEEERRRGREQAPLRMRDPHVSAQTGTAVRTATTDEPIDRVHLARYTLGDVALETEVLGLFAESLPKMVAGLTDARDPTAWRHAAHSLKGSARAIGAWSLADAAARAEKVDVAATTGPASKARDDVIAGVCAAARHVEDAIARDRLGNA